jgi:hypothetical protein
MVGYFSVNSETNHGFVDWDWLMDQVPFDRTSFVRLIRFNEPLTIKINGHQGKGVILKPAEAGGTP